jgi:hypothetical protein
MYRRLLMPLMAVATLLTLFWAILPTGATGAERRLARDTYVFNRDTTIRDRVLGSVQVFGGNVTVANVIEGDLFVVGGTVNFVDAGRVEGDLVYGAAKVSNAQDRIRGGIYSLLSLEGAAASITKSAVVASLLLAWLVVAVVVTLMSGREIRLSSAEVRTSALHCFVVGLVALTSFVLTAIAFSYLVPYMIGIPLLAALGVFGILTKAYGLIAMFHAIGTLVAGSRSRNQLASRKWLRGDLAMVMIGFLILGAIRFIPVIGTIVWGLASVFGVGVALATKFGRRDPWFLQFRSVVA